MAIRNGEQQGASIHEVLASLRQAAGEPNHPGDGPVEYDRLGGNGPPPSAEAEGAEIGIPRFPSQAAHLSEMSALLDDQMSHSTDDTPRRQREPLLISDSEGAADEVPVISEKAAAASREAFKRLVLATENRAPSVRKPIPTAVTIEHMVIEALRPMLQKWVDENLPLVVEHLIAREIQIIMRGEVANHSDSSSSTQSNHGKGLSA